MGMHGKQPETRVKYPQMVSVQDQLTREVKSMGKDRGMDVVGIADPALLDAPPFLRPGDILSGCRSIIVCGKAVPHEAYAEESSHNKFVFQFIDDVESFCAELKEFLERKGYPSLMIGASRPVVFKKGKYRGLVSLKHAAVAAGIGTIGRNDILLSKQFGPRLRMGAVLTTARLDADRPLSKQLCIKGCTLCIEACPYGAIKDGDIDFYACLNNSHGHRYMAATRIVRTFPNWEGLNRLGATLYNRYGSKYKYLCWKCITSCPLFRIKKKGSGLYF